MKIRSFKGHSLERIYDTIRQEMGTEAVIVNTSRPSSLQSIIPSFLGGRAHEVIAIADDVTGDRQAVARLLDSDSVRRLSGINAEKLKTLEKEFFALRTEIRGMSHRTPVSPAVPSPIDGFPDFAGRWDPRFVQRVMAACPDFPGLKERTRQKDALARLIPTESTFKVRKEGGPHVIVLTGPTGSGKTTTLAKLAARWSLGARMKVGIITTDTYRVAAVDQIREYAVLLGLELKIAFSATEAAKAVRAFADKDIVLVDTVGRSHYDESGLKALRGILNGLGRVTTFLLVPATWERTAVPAMIGDFKVTSPTHLVITKLDETRDYDVLTFASAETSMPIVFLTDGQRVPQDLKEAQSADLADLLVPIQETMN